VAELWGGTALLGLQASRQALRERAGQADLLHVAAHGIFDPFDPLASRLELAPAGAAGNLTVSDVLTLDLKATDLAVLSACETAAGRISDGDDVVGLTRAFLAAGAPSVLTTLWPIDDEASAALVTAFYRHLRTPGTSLAAALRAAQLEVAVEERWSSPYYWAGFVLHGDRRSLAAGDGSAKGLTAGSAPRRDRGESGRPGPAP
jgi:CHAT domain-containing protein